MNTTQLIDVLKSGTPQDQMAAAHRLGELGPAASEAADLLLQSIKVGPPGLRITAREALTKLGEAGVRALVDGLPDRDCAVALKEIAPRASQRLLAALCDPRRRGRADALWALSGCYGGDAPVPVEVVACLADPDAEVRENAERVVGANWESVFPRLKEHLPKDGAAGASVREFLREDAERAIGRGDESRLRIVLELVDVREDRMGGLLLASAAGKGEVRMVLLLLERGATPDAKAGWPLQRAVSNDQVATARVLLEHKANVNLRDNYGFCPLHVAKSAAMAKLLLEHGASRSERNSEGLTPYEGFVDQLVQSIINDYGRLPDLPQLIDLVAPPNATLAAEVRAKAEAASRDS
jgi:hypothetical protein